MKPVTLLLLALLLPAAAWAGEPDVRIEGERVVADLVVPAALADVRTVVDDPWTIAGLYGDGTTITRVASGDCDTLQYAVDSFIGAVTYTVRYCVGPAGARATLTEPLADMKAYEASWRVEATDEGTLIHYELDLVPAMKLPRRVVRSSTKRSVKKLFARLQEELGG